MEGGYHFFLQIRCNFSIEIRGIYIKMLRDHEEPHGHHVVILPLVVGAGSISFHLKMLRLSSFYFFLLCSSSVWYHHAVPLDLGFGY